MILISVSKSQQYKGQVEESINIINIKINTYYSESTIFTDLTTLYIKHCNMSRWRDSQRTCSKAKLSARTWVQVPPSGVFFTCIQTPTLRPVSCTLIKLSETHTKHPSKKKIAKIRACKQHSLYTDTHKLKQNLSDPASNYSKL